MQDTRTLKDYHEARAEYYRVWKGCEWRRCFYCGEFFQVGRNSINALLSCSMYCSKKCRKAIRQLTNKTKHRVKLEATQQSQYDWVLDMKTWKWKPTNV